MAKNESGKKLQMNPIFSESEFKVKNVMKYKEGDVTKTKMPDNVNPMDNIKSPMKTR